MRRASVAEWCEQSTPARTGEPERGLAAVSALVWGQARAVGRLSADRCERAVPMPRRKTVERRDPMRPLQRGAGGNGRMAGPRRERHRIRRVACPSCGDRRRAQGASSVCRAQSRRQQAREPMQTGPSRAKRTAPCPDRRGPGGHRTGRRGNRSVPAELERHPCRAATGPHGPVARARAIARISPRCPPRWRSSGPRSRWRRGSRGCAAGARPPARGRGRRRRPPSGRAGCRPRTRTSSGARRLRG